MKKTSMLLLTMFKPNQYQPLQASPGDTNRYGVPYQQQQQQPQQRRAPGTALIFMIMLVATATLLTIIRLTLSPGFSVPSRPPLISAQDSENGNHNLKLNLAGAAAEDVQRKNVVSLTKPNADVQSNVVPNLVQNGVLKVLPKQKLESLVAKESDKIVDQPMSDTKIKSSSSSPINPAITSLTADQRFEKEYRDDPGNLTEAKSNAKQATPKVVFDADDLLETTKMRIDKPDGCGELEGGYADLAIIVYSAANNFEARQAIRDTWGQFALERGAFFYFMLGATLEPHVQLRIEAEDKRHQDLLQGTFIDNYYNLTLKTLSMMHWVSKYCSKIRYVLKVDDDMMVNMQHVADFSEINPNFHRVIIGKLAKKWKPHRDPKNKWFVPFRAFNGTFYPNFVTGPAYFITGDAARPLYETAMNDTEPIFLEDVYVTGIVAEKANIRRYNHALMKNVHLKVDPCTFPRFMTSHMHSPNEIRQLWKLVYSKKCEYIRKRAPAAAAAAASAPLSSGANSTAGGNKSKPSGVLPAVFNLVKKKT